MILAAIAIPHNHCFKSRANPLIRSYILVAIAIPRNHYFKSRAIALIRTNILIAIAIPDNRCFKSRAIALIWSHILVAIAIPHNYCFKSRAIALIRSHILVAIAIPHNHYFKSRANPLIRSHILVAIAAGLLVVCSDAAGAAPDLVINGKNGYLVPPGDGEKLREALQTLVEDENLREKMGLHSQEIIADYTPQKMALGLKEAIAKVSNAQNPKQN